MEEVPKTNASHAPPTIQIMFAALAVDNVCCQRTDIAKPTMLFAHQIAIAHQRNSGAINLRDAMHHKVITIGPRQHHMAYLKVNGFLKNDTLFTTYDKGQHALTIDGQRDANALSHQSAGFFNYHVIVHRAMVL